MKKPINIEETIKEAVKEFKEEIKHRIKNRQMYEYNETLGYIEQEIKLIYKKKTRS